MRLTAMIMLVFCLQLSAKTYSQKISLSQRSASLKSVFREIEKQSGYRFFYKDKVLKDLPPVQVQAKSAGIRDVLEQCLSGTGLMYDIVDDVIVIRQKPPAPPAPLFIPVPDTELKGVVRGADGTPLPGATIRIKGSLRGTSTDSTGRFTLRLPDEGGTLEVSFLGFETQEVVVPAGTPGINIMLKTRNFTGDEIVVVGYGTQKKSQLIGSVSQIGGKDINNRPVTQLSQALTGQVPGVTVIQRSGRPGTAGTVQVRGVGSFGATASPLVLIDGIPGGMNDIDPNDVENISVLKDASSAAIYGSRAANGVILITTKNGTASSGRKVKVAYNGYAGMQRITSTPQFVNSAEYATLMNEAQPGAYSPADIEKFRNGSDPDNFSNADYISASFRDRFMQTGHNLTVSSGNETTQYLLSAGYLFQDGLVKRNDYQRYNMRFNLSTNIRKNLKLTTRISAIQSNTNEPTTPATLDATTMPDIISNVVRYTPIYPIKMSNGDWGVGVVNKGNPVAWLDSDAFARSRGIDLNGNLRLDWFPIQDLKVSLIGGYTQAQGEGKTFLATQRINDNIFLGPSSLSQSSSFGNYKTAQVTADYTKRFGKHEIGVLGGYSFEENYSEGLSAARTNLPSNDLTVLPLGDPSTQTNGSSATASALSSFFGRLQYNFGRKYLLEGTVRYDGSSRFPTNDKYAVFPSMAAGWRISEENFMKGRISWIDELKLKASYGTLGNQSIGDYTYQNVLNTGYNYPFGGQISAGASRITMTDTTIHWESTRTKDIGIDGSLFKGKLSFSAGYFDRYTYDILVSPGASVSWVLGVGVGQQNSGKLSNRGWEFTLNHRNNVGRFSYNVGGNLSIIKNEVLDLGVGNIRQPNGLVGNGSNLFIGYPTGMYYGYVADGLFTDDADVAAWKTGNDMTALNPNPKPGDVRYKDISGPEGKPDGKVTAAYDRTYLGTTLPKYTFGFNLGGSWKGFDVGVLLQGVGGVKGYLNNYAGWAFYQNGNIQRWQVDERWTPENPDRNAGYPRLEIITNQGTPNTLQSSYWMLNGAYVRLKSVQVGYSLPKSLLQRAGIEAVRVNLSAENLHTWSRYRKGWDPEVNTGGSYYPILASYTLGLNVNF